MASSQQGRPRRTTNRVGVGLSEPHPSGSELVDIRRLEIVRSVAIGIKGALIVRKQNDDIRFERCGLSTEERSNESKENSGHAP